MPRLLLMLPTQTYRTPALLAAAARCGVELTVASEEDSAVGHLNPGGFLTLPFSTPDACAEPVREFSRQYPIDAVIGIDDSVIEAAAVVARALELPHNDPNAVAVAKDKRRSREQLAAGTVACPEFVWRSFDDPDRDLSPEFGFPAVVKPLELSASRGVIRVDDADELAAAVSRVEAIVAGEADCPTEAGFLIESFVSGPEVAVEGLLRNGVLEVLAVFDKPDPLEGPYFEESIYLTPSRLSESQQAELAETSAAACLGLGLSEGAVHIELRVTQSGPVVIEVNPRAIGGLCSDVLKFGTGLTLEELLLNHALGDRAALPDRVDRAAGVLMLSVGAGGKLVRVEGVERAEAVAGVERVAITAHPGQPLQAWPEGGPYPGFVFAAAETLEEVERALQSAGEMLTLVYED
jgi:biotin carboxylase